MVPPFGLLTGGTRGNASHRSWARGSAQTVIQRLVERQHTLVSQAIASRINPVALPPGRASVSTNPEPTGSGTFANTIGTVRVALTNAAAVVPPVAKRTSGSSATSSDA